VKIINNQLAMFVPFENRNYTNVWSKYLTFSDGLGGSLGLNDNSSSKSSSTCSYANYLKRKEKFFGPVVYDHLSYSERSLLEKDEKDDKENEEKILKKLYTKGNHGKIYTPPPPPSSSNFSASEYGNTLVPLLNMLLKLCYLRQVPDIDFFIGGDLTRPQIKKNLTDIDDKMFPTTDTASAAEFPLSREKYTTYAPILSFFGNKEKFGDIIVPSMNDWVNANEKEDNVTNTNTTTATKWNKKKQVCYYRGKISCFNKLMETAVKLSSTMAIAKEEKMTESTEEGKTEKKKEKKEKEKEKKTEEKIQPFLDADFVPFLDDNVDECLTDRIISISNSSTVDFIIPPISSVKNNVDENRRVEGKVEKVEGENKYLLYIEDDDSRQNYSKLMGSKSVIFKVANDTLINGLGPTSVLEPWYQELLKPMKDHVLIKSDLSNLESKIKWAKSNDMECMQISATAHQLQSNFLSTDTILDYWQFVLIQLAKQLTAPAKLVDKKDNGKSKINEEKRQQSLFVDEDLLLSSLAPLPPDVEDESSEDDSDDDSTGKRKSGKRRPKKKLTKSEIEDRKIKKFENKTELNKLKWENYQVYRLTSFEKEKLLQKN
jgi:hypothetical protein